MEKPRVFVRFLNFKHLVLKDTMYNLFLIVGSIVIVVGLIFFRIRCWPVLHPEAELFINLLSTYCSEKGKHKA